MGLQEPDMYIFFQLCVYGFQLRPETSHDA